MLLVSQGTSPSIDEAKPLNITEGVDRMKKEAEM